MKVEEVAKLTPVRRLLYWMEERNAIHLRRQAGQPAPWTDDVILQSVFFTNPYRENDKVTVWLRERVRNPLRDHPIVAFAVAAFRWFTWIPTGERLVGNADEINLLASWDPVEAKRRLKPLPKQFTGAYNISNSGSRKPKLDRVIDDYIQPLWDKRYEMADALAAARTMEAAHDCLRTHFLGLGGSGFMAYEIVCDLRYTFLLEDATDKLTWSNMGPGAKRGLNRALGRPIDSPISKQEWAVRSKALLELATVELVDKKGMPPMEMREIEHSLCEFDKMERARLGQGHIKRKYKGS